MQNFNLFIGGKWTEADSGETFITIDPSMRR